MSALERVKVSISRGRKTVFNLSIRSWTDPRTAAALVEDHLVPDGYRVAFFFNPRLAAMPHPTTLLDACRLMQRALVEVDGVATLANHFGHAFSEGRRPSGARLRLFYKLAAPPAGHVPAPAATAAVPAPAAPAAAAAPQAAAGCAVSAGPTTKLAVSGLCACLLLDARRCNFPGVTTCFTQA
jgi:hypothetical protein